jgi:hypothetical protein
MGTPSCPSFFTAALSVIDPYLMPDRLRHCVECPECSTRYLIGFSPYQNGSYLVSFVTEVSEEYKLFCSCRRPQICSRWKWNELKTYSVSNRAYARGYGGPDEIWLLRHSRDREPTLNLTLRSEARKKEQ